MPKYKVTVGTLFHNGRKHVRGDIIETDIDYGSRVEPHVETEEKPKRKRRTKAEIEAEAAGVESDED